MRLFRVWLVLVVVGALAWGADGASAVDPRIERSRTDLEAARAAERALTDELDRAAAEFEQARAHAERLAAEAGDNVRAVTAARGVAEEADGVLRDRLMLLYAHPEVRVQVLSAAMVSDDVAETLHRLDLIGQLARFGAEDRRRADRALLRVRGAEHSYHVVTAGVRGAVRTRRERAAGLGVALHRAQRHVEEARADVRDAEAAVAAERAAERRERERLRRRALTAGGATVALPPVDGRTCPLGAPNAFSDTWGAPRSGGRTHQGVDMFAGHGAPLYAVADGTARVGNSALGGLSVHVSTDDGDRYYYAHLSAVLVANGERVRGGQHIGANGNSGNARGMPPHLHWQYHPGGGAPVNPYPLAYALCRG